MKNSTFQSYSHIVDQAFGIQLPPAKMALLESRLYSLFQSKDFKTPYDNAESFLAYVESDKTGKALRVLGEAITTHHTFFLRESDHFRFFRDNVLPWMEEAAAGDRDLRVWCAASSTGEEAYTLAMLLADRFALKTPSWERTLLATDLARNVLETAKRGLYPRESIRVLPPAWQQLYFHMQGDYAAVSDSIKTAVTYRPFNLMTPSFPFRRQFHTIFCRNVMIYFDIPTRRELVRKFYDFLLPGGYLFVGHAEAIQPEFAPFIYVEPSVYRKPLAKMSGQGVPVLLPERSRSIMRAQDDVRNQASMATRGAGEAQRILSGEAPVHPQGIGYAPSNVARATESTIDTAQGSLAAEASPTRLHVTPFTTNSIVNAMTQVVNPKVFQTMQTTNPIQFNGIKLIAIGASTGGTEALAKVLSMLPPPLPPILVVQHIPPGFSRMFAERLNNDCSLAASEAIDGERLMANHIYVAPGGKHMQLKPLGTELFVIVKPGELVNGHCPSVDVMFNSCTVLKKNVFGVILTGMGDDGARGLLAMRKAGAHTVGQDEKTCVVYGMPRAAKMMGGVEREAPLESIAGIIKAACS